jgi:glycosyltransferase involved in cell wall biosynthesis
MRGRSNIAVIIPAFNEEKSIAKVIFALPAWVDDCVVVDNGSTDKTAEMARAAGARAVFEPRRGYGSACLAGMKFLGMPDIVVFLDGDFSDFPEEMDRLVDPIVRGEADLVIGSRLSGGLQPGALTTLARLGNGLVCRLMNWFWEVQYTDLGPFRAISFPALIKIAMASRDYGWTVEMQIKAAQKGLRSREVPVSYRPRIGKSKISGTLKGAILAGMKILFTVCSLAWSDSTHKGNRLNPPTPGVSGGSHRFPD